MIARKKSSKARSAGKAIRAKAPKKASTTAKVAKKVKAAATKAVVANKAKEPIVLSSKPIAQKQSKSQIYSELADIAQVSKHEVKNVIVAMKNLIERHVKPKGSGEIVIPELGIKVRRIQKKASKARMGRNPFTGEEIQIPAKAARKSVKVSAMKTLKALIAE